MANRGDVIAREAIEQLSAVADADVLAEERLSHHTTLRIGGPCAAHVTCHTYTALVDALGIMTGEGIPWVVLGKGSNLLVADEGFSGCVVALGREFSRISDTHDGTHVTVGAGALLSRVVSEAQKRGLSGLERCVGIPGTLGGALSMNAGSANEWIGDVVHEVVSLHPGEGMRRRSGEEISWGYRSSSLPGGEIVLEATLKLKEGDPDGIALNMERRLQRRRKSQPMGLPSCGSVFRNPKGRHAAALVEECGLKGAAVGGAQISDIHANFIVNKGTARAADVVELMRRMYEGVRDQAGIELEPEVKFLGFSGR